MEVELRRRAVPYVKSWLNVLLSLGCAGRTVEPVRRPEQLAAVGVIAALPQEITRLERSLTGERTEGEVRIGRLRARSIAVTLSGMGKVNAAAAAQRLISENSVKCIIVSGVGGRINPSLQVGDMVIATRVIQHDFGFLGPSGLTRHRPGFLPELTGDTLQAEDISFPLGRFWRESGDSLPAQLARSGERLQSQLTPLRVGAKTLTPRVRVGVVATGDQFIASAEKQNELRALGVDVVEMEGAAVVQVAHKYRIPVLLIRAVSDSADGDAAVDFGTFAEAAAHNNAILIEALFSLPDFQTSCPA
jgi:adenosylhomocysteine nucleosidase